MAREIRENESYSAFRLSAAVTVATVCACGLVLFLQARQAAAIHDCRPSLERFAAAFRAYLQDSPDHIAPALSLKTPRRPAPELTTSHPLSAAFDALSPDDGGYGRFVYLGYMLESEQDFGALESHRAGRLTTSELESIIPLPETRADGRNAILRLRLTGDQPIGGAWSGWYLAPSRIPVLIERRENHRPLGSHILFLDGHVEYLPYPSTWPLTRRVVRTLDQLVDPDLNQSANR